MATSLILSNPFSSFFHLPDKHNTVTSKSTSNIFTFSSPIKTSKSNSLLFVKKNSRLSPKLLRTYRKILAGSSEIGETDVNSSDEEVVLVGEDSAEFDFAKQKISSWIYFSAILGIVLFVLDVAWINNSTGFSKAFIDAVSTISGSHEVVMLTLTLIFAIVHSGLASFRDEGEKLIGERAFRVLFAGTSLPLVVSTVI
ncbi:zeta-carotene isomerase [Sarracenia purpurea var. burkii]